MEASQATDREGKKLAVVSGRCAAALVTRTRLDVKQLHRTTMVAAAPLDGDARTAAEDDVKKKKEKRMADDDRVLVHGKEEGEDDMLEVKIMDMIIKDLGKKMILNNIHGQEKV